MKPQDFIDALAPAAQANAARTGIPASAVVAQGAWESGWGTSVLAVQAQNLFGIKADPSWRGPTVTMPTVEYVNGERVTVSARWRKYDSWDECIDDHASYFLQNRNYAAAITCRDGEGFVRLIAAAGYATDPKYASDIIGLIREFDLTILDTNAKSRTIAQSATQVQNTPSFPKLLRSSATPAPAPAALTGVRSAVDAATKRYIAGGVLLASYIASKKLGIDDPTLYDVILGLMGGLGVMHATLTNPAAQDSSNERDRP